MPRETFRTPAGLFTSTWTCKRCGFAYPKDDLVSDLCDSCYDDDEEMQEPGGGGSIRVAPTTPEGVVPGYQDVPGTDVLGT